MDGNAITLDFSALCLEQCLRVFGGYSARATFEYWARSAGEDAAAELGRHNRGGRYEDAWDADHLGAFNAWAEDKGLVDGGARAAWPEFRDGYEAVSGIEFCE
jgi:hypothetical protein